VEAADGKSAVERLADKPDLILQDLLLPDITGYDLVLKLKARAGDPPPPILALSGYLEKQEQPWEEGTGFDGFLVKPVPREELLAKVGEQLAKRRGG
jgi:CheY-like chemotaxis protein